MPSYSEQGRRSPVSHRLPPQGYDEPESLSYTISSICPMSADGEQAEVSRARGNVSS